MAAEQFFLPFPTAFSSNGLPEAGAKVYFYLTGTTTPSPIYQDAALTTEHTNPVVADSAGRLRPIYLDETVTYKVAIKDSAGNALGSDIDPYIPGVFASDATLAAFEVAGGAALVGFRQDGTGAVARTAQAKMREVVSVTDFAATGDGTTDDSTNAQKAIDALSSGGTVRFPRGTYKLATGLTVSNADVCLEFEAGASISYTTATLIPITISGARCKIKGGKISAPATFDGTNSSITYGVIKVTGDYCVIDGLYIDNVPRVGIWFSKATNGIVSNCVIDGGTSEGFYTGANTVHFGIIIDTPNTGSQGNFVIDGNIIRRCVQGAGSGSTGTVGYEQAMAVTGNVFELCWNHGWYSSGLARGHSITGNAFNSCQTPIAATGTDHVISSNTMTVQTTGTAVSTDNEITGISLRDPVRCIVSNNIIKGENVDGGTVISLDDLSGVSGENKVTDNIVSDNTILITNSATGGAIAIRLQGNSTEVSNNIVQGNVITCPARASNGLIQLAGSSGSSNNIVKNNIVRMTRYQASCAFALLNTLSHTSLSGNTFELVADAAAAATLVAIQAASCSYLAVNDNWFVCSASWGANITFRVFQEITAGTLNSASRNRTHFDTTKLVGSELFVVLNSGPFLLDHVSTGAPEGSVIAGPGSIWRRTDGAAGTTLYVKESGNSNTGWRQMGKAAAPTTTYVAPTGGATTDAECRASLAQLADDVADLKTKLAAALVTA